MRVLLCALVPALAALALRFLGKAKRPVRMTVAVGAALATSLLLVPSLVHPAEQTVTLFRLTDQFFCAVRLDRTGTIYLGLAAFLWPFSMLYAVEYMAHEEKERYFFSWYLLAYAAVILLASAANLFTLYIFYEMLTLVTVPLVWHKRDRESIRAARTYLYCLLGGAALGFFAMVTAGAFGATAFRFGGALVGTQGKETFLRAMAVLGFVGFGVKAAVFPLCHWLPKASVAPTPVTALLHAAAVVNAGVFSVARLIYFTFGPDLLRFTFAQDAMLTLSAVTVVYAATRAVRETRLKQRLAWSTVSNLSYMLVGLSLMTTAGLTAGLLHMVYHGLMKIVLFFCAGAILVQTGLTEIRGMHGLGRHLPHTFVCFTASELSLSGTPPLIGFVSKYYLVTAALREGTVWSMMGAVSLIAAAILTAIYTYAVIVPAWFMPAGDPEAMEKWRDPGACMKIALVALTLAVVLAGFFIRPLVALLGTIAA